MYRYIPSQKDSFYLAAAGFKIRFHFLFLIFTVGLPFFSLGGKRPTPCEAATQWQHQKMTRKKMGLWMTNARLTSQESILAPMS